jgi:hypothetical protein
MQPHRCPTGGVDARLPWVIFKNPRVWQIFVSVLDSRGRHDHGLARTVLARQFTAYPGWRDLLRGPSSLGFPNEGDQALPWGKCPGA